MRVNDGTGGCGGFWRRGGEAVRQRAWWSGKVATDEDGYKGTQAGCTLGECLESELSER